MRPAFLVSEEVFGTELHHILYRAVSKLFKIAFPLSITYFNKHNIQATEVDLMKASGLDSYPLNHFSYTIGWEPLEEFAIKEESVT